MNKGNERGLSCDICKEILRATARIGISRMKGNKNGIFISNISPPNSLSPRNYCLVCRLFESTKLDPSDYIAASYPEYRGFSPISNQVSSESNEPERAYSYELRAFPFLNNYDGINEVDTSLALELGATINLAVVPTNFNGYQHPQALKRHCWKRGHLFFEDVSNADPNLMSARIIPRHFDASVVQAWLGYCMRHHAKTCAIMPGTPQIKVIDCDNMTIVSAPANSRYIALSYVWGQSKKTPLKSEVLKKLVLDHISLPIAMPKVIEDAITVTKALGYRYLWVDKYCINQYSAEKHAQIQQMDLVFNCSELTIIAAAGSDENTGLPGVSTTQRSLQPVVTSGNIRLISTMAHPHHTIKNSTYITRGWTLQESILSRRRLVFTEDQVYFECNVMNCFEGLYSPLDVLHTKRKDRFRACIRSGLFTGKDEGIQTPIFGKPFGTFDERKKPWSFHFIKFLILVTNYSSRNLTFDSDSLNAFVGIMAQFQTAHFPIRQILGIPFICPSIFPEEKIHRDCVVAALCWRHIECCWMTGQVVKRRKGFPSWTWAGWAGTVSWTDLFTDGIMDVKSLVEEFRCELDDGTLIKLSHYNQWGRSDQNQKVSALRLSAWLVPPGMISLHGSETTPIWKLGSFKLELHISCFGGHPSQFLDAFNQGYLEVIFVGKGLYNSYFLVIKPHGSSATRIGAAEAIYFYDTTYHRFADEIHADMVKREIRLI